MTEHGGKVVGLRYNIHEVSQISAMLDAIWADGGPLTGLVNNAAGKFTNRKEDLSPRGFDAVSTIAFRGSCLVTLDCGKRWLASGMQAPVISIVTTWVWSGSTFAVRLPQCRRRRRRP